MTILTAEAAAVLEADVERLRAELAPDKPTLLLLPSDSGEDAARYLVLLRRVADAAANVLSAELRDGGLLVSGRSGAPVSLPLDEEDDAAARALWRLRVNRIDLIASETIDLRVTRLVETLLLPYDVTLLAPTALEQAASLIWLADRWLTPVQDVALRLKRTAPMLNVIPVSIPEPYAPPRFELSVPPFRPDEPFRVLVPDAPSRRTPGRLLEEASALIATEKLPIKLYLLAAADRPEPLRLDARSAVVIGAWGQDNLNDLVCLLRPHMAWLPFASAPAGHGSVLSDVMNQGLPVLASSIGAAPERLNGRRMSWLLPPETDAAGWVSRMAGLLAGGLAEPADARLTSGAHELRNDFYPKEYLSALL